MDIIRIKYEIPIGGANSIPHTINTVNRSLHTFRTMFSIFGRSFSLSGRSLARREYPRVFRSTHTELETIKSKSTRSSSLRCF